MLACKGSSSWRLSQRSLSQRVLILGIVGRTPRYPCPFGLLQSTPICQSNLQATAFLLGAQPGVLVTYVRAVHCAAITTMPRWLAIRGTKGRALRQPHTESAQRIVVARFVAGLSHETMARVSLSSHGETATPLQQRVHE